jgi:hypothetical protein
MGDQRSAGHQPTTAQAVLPKGRLQKEYMAAVYFEDYPTGPEKVILSKPLTGVSE